MEQQKIVSGIYRIIENLKGDALMRELWDREQESPLTGDKWNLSAVDMAYLFLETEKQFEIKIAAVSIKDYQFNTIKGIEEIVSKALYHRQ